MGLLAEQKLERRERILEVARSLIAEDGYDGVTMRNLAEASGVSVPTLYNLCGSKDELLYRAVADEVDSTIARLGSSRQLSGLRRVLALLGVGHEEMSRRPTYYRMLLGAASRSEGVRAPLNAIGERLSSELRDALDEMGAAGELETWVDTGVLAQRLRAVCVGASFEWAAGSLSTDEVLPTTRYGGGLVLLGVTRGKATSATEKVVRREQRALSRMTSAPTARRDRT